MKLRIKIERNYFMASRTNILFTKIFVDTDILSFLVGNK